jgi:aspartate kinase
MPNSIIVQKYGGSSVATLDKIKNIAKRIVKRKKQGASLVIVVSAKGDTTNKLLQEAKKLIHPQPIPLREADMLLSVGERISIAYLSMAINSLGAECVSLTGSQCGIITDCNHTDAKILEIRPHRVLKALNQNKIVIVAGYQGVSTQKEITTLGRGGSDLTAVALSIALQAEKCEIYSDVDGVFDSNPKDNPNAKLLKTLTKEEMVEMASSGAKVIDLNAAKFWQQHSDHNIKIEIAHSEKNKLGTIITTQNLSENQIKAVNVIPQTNVIYVEKHKKPEFFAQMKKHNLIPVMFFKDKDFFKVVLDKEKSEIFVNDPNLAFSQLFTDYGIISAIGTNIGTDIEIIDQWENIIEEHISTHAYNHTHFNVNKITTLLPKESLQKVKEKVYTLLKGSGHTG